MDAAKYSPNILPFPRLYRPPRPAVGWVRQCMECGQPYIQQYQTGAVRSDRVRLCISCWIEKGMFE